jgi:hypothetical protein
MAAGADGNGRDRLLFTWRDRVLAEASCLILGAVVRKIIWDASDFYYPKRDWN